MQTTDTSASEATKNSLIDAMRSSRGTRYLTENQTAVDAMTEQHLAECMLTAATLGYLSVMKELWHRRGPFPVVYENEEGAEVGRLNGALFKPKLMKRFLPFAVKPGQLRQVFRAIQKYQIKGLIEPGLTYPFMFKELDLQTMIRLQSSRRFKGELPFLQDSILHRPELALAMEAEGQSTGLLEAYRPMLCWATEDMILQHSAQLTPLRTMQKVEFRVRDDDPGHGPGELLTMPIDQFKADLSLGDQVAIHMIELGVEADDRHSSSASLLFRSMGSEALENGFGDDQGRVLCETHADFLLGFLLAHACPENEEDAHQFIIDSFPLGILANHVAKVCNEQFAHDVEVSKNPTHLSFFLAKRFIPASENFFDMNLYAGDVSRKLVELLRPDQWRSLFKYTPTARMRPRALVTFRDVYNMDNEGISLILDTEDVDELSACNYRFKAGTLVAANAEEYGELIAENQGSSCILIAIDSHQIMWSSQIGGDRQIYEELLRVHGLLRKMNIWTGNGASPPSAAQALDELIRFGGVDVNSIRAMGTVSHLAGLGVEACAQAASGTEHWNLVAKMFSAEQLTPYLTIMPRESKGLVLEGALGL